MIQVEEVSHKYNDRYSVEEEEVNETDLVGDTVIIYEGGIKDVLQNKEII